MNSSGADPDLQHISCDNSVIVYADGEELLTVSDYERAVTAEIPCGTDVVGYEATSYNGSKGLKVAYEYDDWGTGYGVLVCATGNVDSGWKLPGNNNALPQHHFTLDMSQVKPYIEG